jgi:polysaccharide transporter, PST family
MLRALYKSASLRAAMILGLGGLAFTLSSLILAKILGPREYGLVSLVIGIVSVAGLTAPLGLDQVIGRRGLPLDRKLRRAILSISTGVGLLTAVVSAFVYHLEPALAMCILVITVASGLMQASAACFQGQQRFGPATWLIQLSNWALLAAALLTAALGFKTAVEPCVLLALVMALGGTFAWVLAGRATAEIDVAATRYPSRALMGEAISLVTNHTSNSIFLQLERLLLAPLAGVQALALFGVVAALVAAPFRMLQMAILFTLIPNLRRTGGARERRRLLGREIMLVSAVMGAASVVIWYASPPLAHWFLSGRYDLSPALMCAALVAGALKLCSAFATGTVIALAEGKGLRILSIVSWGSIGVSVLGALLAAPWGLVGVLYGISTGLLARSLIAAWMAMTCLTHDDAPYPSWKLGSGIEAK